jgi:two-component system cell cycle sensor histidine kinase/response regulator CckA
MKKPSDSSHDWEQQREKVIGLGTTSIKKSYYPQLQNRLAELERFRFLLDQSPDTILLVSLASGKIEDANISASEQTGYPREALLTFFIKDIFPEELVKTIVSLFPQQSASSEKKHIITSSLRSNTLREIPVEMTVRGARFTDADYLLIIARDITKRRKAEEDRAKLESQLRQLQKMEAMGTFAGGIAHDFNNILTAIIGYGSLLRQRMGKDSPFKGYIDDILAAAERAASLTRSLLAFSRKQEIKLKPENLNEIVKRINALLLRVIGEDIELKSVSADEELNVLADSNQIEQVLMNLVTNARDAMPDGGILTLRTERTDIKGSIPNSVVPPGEYAVLSVTDTGTGMDEETKKRIFEPFFTKKTVGKGTGLGLSIAYGIIRQHDGEITVYSEPGKGTTFKVYLKLSKTGTRSADAAPVAAPVGGVETILVAEDDSAVRRFVRTMLEEYGYTVIEAVDGEDAVEKFRENRERIQLLILDVIMPKKNGKEAYEEICKMRSDVPVLFSSGYTADIIGKKGILEEGFNFISKPISLPILLSKIREILSQ